MNTDHLRYPSLIVFFSNTCIMIVELVAGRLIAPYVGVSLYTWTSVIGVILAGLSVGNYWGGKLADRSASRRLLGLLFLLSGLACLGVLGMVEVISQRGLPVVLIGLPLIVRILFIVTAIFFIPSLALGLISPVVVKLALRDLAQTGGTIGRIYASSAFGSILGTFATGFFLISWFGTRLILLGIAVALMAIGLWLGRFIQDWRLRGLSVILLVAGAFLVPKGAWLQGPCLRETNYFCIKVLDETLEDGTQAKALVLDRLVHGFTVPGDPTRMVYGYEKIAAEVAEYWQSRQPLESVLVLGGGAYSFPRYVEALYPSARVEVVEIDPGVTEIAYEQFGLARDTAVRSVNVDARQFLETRPETQPYDLILCDAVNDVSVPYHLTTREFAALVRRHLADDGVYMVNLIDGRERRFALAMARTLQSVFAEVVLVPTGADWETNSRTTFVLLASPQPIDREALQAATGGDGAAEIGQWAVTAERLAQLLNDAPALVLTDDYVPVDNLLAPVVDASE
jgi:predicted membrane-bound spermidine synthase